MGFRLRVPRLDKVAGKFLNKAGHLAATPVKFVGGQTAKFLGSKATFADFDRGLDKLLKGKVKQDDVNRAFNATGTFIRNAPAAAVRNTAAVAKDVTREAAQGAGGLLEGAFSGLFKGGGLPLLVLLGVGLYVLFGTGAGKRILG